MLGCSRLMNVQHFEKGLYYSNAELPMLAKKSREAGAVLRPPQG